MFTKISLILSTLFLTVAGWVWLAAPVQADATAPGAQANLRINEIMASNATGLQDPDEPGQFPDWIELYNPGPGAVTLDGLFISDDPTLPTRFAFANDLSIAEGGFLVLFADDDGKQGPRHLNFKLSATGETIGLYSAGGATLIDSRTFGVQTTDISTGRQPDGFGEWRFLGKATPDASNSILAPAILTVQRTPAQPTAGAPVEVIATITDNGTIAATLYYSTPGASLTAIAMTAAGGDLYKAQLPPQPDGVLVSYLVSAKDNDNQTTTSPARAPLQTYKYLVGYQPPSLVINEFMADNKSVLEDPPGSGLFPDWIELYNPSANPVSLDNLYLSDDDDSPTLYPIPAGLTIPAGGYLLFFADGSPELGAQHTNFKLNDVGEQVGLYGAVGSYAIDSQSFNRQTPNLAYGRLPDGADAWQALVCPSPGGANLVCDKSLYLPVLSR